MDLAEPALSREEGGEDEADREHEIWGIGGIKETG
jgi:hypothetical protein